MNFYTYKSISEGHFICSINLSELYQSEELEKFWKRYSEFCKADHFLEQMIKKEDNTLTYSHKSWIPIKSDNRPKALLLFGNPAPHSVIADIYFAYEGKGKEHRFWKVMKEVGFIDMKIDKDIENTNNILKSKFFNLEYISPFVLGMEVFFTFPSPASEKKWSGVMGLQKLFGKKVFDKLAQAEKIRVEKLIDDFIKDGGTIIAFQKDAYNGVVKEGQYKYNLKQAVEGKLHTQYVNNITLVGVPPTRWMHTTKMKNVLRNLIK